MSEKYDLTIDDLATAAGVSVRTVRFYVSEGLLPGPGARGKGAAYGAEHLLRLRLIRRLVERRVPLADIRARITALSLDEVRALLAEEDRAAATLARAGAEQSPKDYIAALLSRAREARDPPAVRPTVLHFRTASSREAPLRPTRPASFADQAAEPVEMTTPDTWRRVELAPGVELHIREDADETQRDLIDRLLTAANEEQGGRQR